MCTKHNVVDGLTKAVNQQVPRNMLNTLKIEPLETFMQTCVHQFDRSQSIQNELMSEQKSTPAARGVNPNAGHKDIVRGCQEILNDIVRGGREFLKSIVKDCREILKDIVRDCREHLENIVRD